MAEVSNPIEKGKQIDSAASVIIGGQVFEGWESVSITESIESIAHSFSISLYDKFAGLHANWPFKPGVSVKIVMNRQRVLTGYLEKLNVDFDKNNRGFSISGRSKAGDLVDCAHKGTKEFVDISLDKLAEELVKPFGIKVYLSVEPKVISKFAVKPDESVFEALDRAARLQGFFFISTRNGNIRLTKAAANEARFKAATNLEQDVNILSASAEYDNSGRHDEYIVKGQQTGSDDFFGAAVALASGTAYDKGITRYRPVEIIAEGNADSEICQKRAQWEASVRLAKALRINASVQGWTQKDGSLWGANQLVRIKSRFLGINKRMLISSLNRDESVNEGKTTKLTLVDPQSYSTQPDINKNPKDDLLDAIGAEF